MDLQLGNDASGIFGSKLQYINIPHKSNF